MTPTCAARRSVIFASCLARGPPDLLGHKWREMTEHYVKRRTGERVKPLRCGLPLNFKFWPGG